MPQERPARTDAPPFTLQFPGGPLHLADLRGQTVLLAFLPEGGRGPGNLMDDLAPLGVRTLGVSGEGWTHLAFADGALGAVSLLIHVGPEEEVTRRYGAAERALHVIGPDGRLVWQVELGAGERITPAQILAALHPPDVDAPPPRDEAAALRLALTRRQFLTAALATSVVLAAPRAVAQEVSAPPAGPLPTVGPGAADVPLRVNGVAHTLKVEPRVSLLDALRDHLALTGTKKGCNQGTCGACTVLVDGERVVSCLTLAPMCAGREVTTIEGLARGEELHPLQAALIEHDGFQCGFCTSGQIMSGVALLCEGHAGSRAEIREWMSGNLCRCSAYDGIVDAIESVKEAGNAGIALLARHP